MGGNQHERRTMPVIVIGGSAGSIDSLRHIARNLPPRLDAAVFVVIHLSPFRESNLAAVLSAAGPLPATPARDGERIEAGRIYVARPDHHLLIDGERVVVWRGPKENRQRPAINALFRSAVTPDNRLVIAVVLSGVLDDGTSGIWWVKRRGGVTVVQDPEEAMFPDMPMNALQHIDADYVVRAAEIGPLLARLVDEARRTDPMDRIRR